MTKIIKLVNPSVTLCSSLKEDLEPFSLFTPPPPEYVALKSSARKNMKKNNYWLSESKRNIAGGKFQNKKKSVIGAGTSAVRNW